VHPPERWAHRRQAVQAVPFVASGRSFLAATAGGVFFAPGRWSLIRLSPFI
jgi:hypothetical protein